MEEEKATLHLQKEADQTEIRKKDERIAKLMGQVKNLPREYTCLRGMYKPFCYIIWILLFILVCFVVFKFGLQTDVVGRQTL